MRFDSVVIPIHTPRLPAVVAQQAGHEAPTSVLYQGSEEIPPIFVAALRAALSSKGSQEGDFERHLITHERGMGRVFATIEMEASRDGSPIEGTVLYLEDDAVVPGPLWSWLLSGDTGATYGILPRVTYNAGGRPPTDLLFQHFSGVLAPASALGALADVVGTDPGPDFDRTALDYLSATVDGFRPIAEVPAPLYHLTTPALGSAFDTEYEAWGGNQMWDDSG
jgi:hypothetical protein